MTKLRDRRQGRGSSARRDSSDEARAADAVHHVVREVFSRHVIGSVSGSAQVPIGEAQVGCSRCIEDREHLRCEWRVQNVPRALRCAEKVCAVPSCEICVDHHERRTGRLLAQQECDQSPRTPVGVAPISDAHRDLSSVLRADSPPDQKHRTCSALP